MILQTGKIISGDYLDWNIKIIDDRAGETGGFYIFLENQEKKENFDYWFENWSALSSQLSEFNVIWNKT